MNDVKQKVLTLIRQHQMLSVGQKVLVAVSGGADSMTLLSILLDLREQLGLPEVAVTHVHHGLRGREADNDAELIGEFCRQRNIRFFLHHADIVAEAALQHKGIEETGRDVRYAVFADLAREHGFHRIATAHTANDAMETVLFHMIRGTGESGLKGIPPIRDNIIRPLLLCSRTDIEQYCADNHISYAIDSTNTDIQFARNRIRKQIVPELYEINPRVDDAFARLMTLAQEDEAYWNEQTEKAIGDITLDDRVYNATALYALHPALRKRVLRCLIRNEANISCEERQIRNVEDILQSGGSISLGSEVFASVKQGYFTISAAWGTPTCLPLLNEIPYVFGNDTYLAQIWDYKKFQNEQNVHRNLLQFACDYDKITGECRVRSRLPGDGYSPYRRGGYKTLKKWFNAERVPEIKRDYIPIVEDEQGIVLVVGMACDSRVALDEQTENVLVFIKQEFTTKK